MEHWQALIPVTPDSSVTPAADGAATLQLPEVLVAQINTYAGKFGVGTLTVVSLAYLILNRLYRGEGTLRLQGNSGQSLSLDFNHDLTASQWFKQTHSKAPGLPCPLYVDAIEAQQDDAAITLLIEQHTRLTVILNDDASNFNAMLVADNLLAIIERLISDEQKRLVELAALSDLQQTWFKKLNRTEKFYPELTITQQFENQTMQTPDAAALQFDGEVLNYRELNCRANRLSHYLVEQGIGVEDRVVIYADRGFDCLVAILAVMKSGAAFVPVDPVFSSARSHYIMGDSGATIILTQSHLQHKLADCQLPQLAIDQAQELLQLLPDHNPNVVMSIDALAYILYTSGSTGQPKGVLVAHRGVSNLVWSMAKAWQVSTDTRYLQFASMSFDASVPEWATTLICGGCVVFKPAKALGLDECLVDLLEQEQITIMKMPAAALTVLPYRELPCLRVIITAGDACNQALVDLWGKGRDFFNCYGPTEMSIGTSMYPCIWGDGHPCIGRPNYNTQVYILDEELNQLPVGRIGEIYLSGVGVTRGYNNQPAMTAEKFLPNPYANDGSRLYQSGDLGYYRADGLIEFCGRADEQVKIRGFRVELGEIERVMLKHQDIAAACVLLHKNAAGVERLVGYFVANSEVDKATLIDWMAHLLPEYMVPSVFKAVESFALTTNGKIDKKALPALSEADFGEQYEAPQGELENLIAFVWQIKLGLSCVGRNDNFYDLGGSSLNAVQVCADLSERLGKTVPVATLLTQPMMLVFAEKVAQLQQDQLRLPQRKRLTAFPASSAQQRLYFMHALQPDNAFYNICLALKVKGKLNIAKLSDCYQQLLMRHESLRTRFYKRDNEIFQQPMENVTAMSKVDLCGFERHMVEQFLVAHGRTLFDLDSGQLCSAKVFKLAEDDHVLSIVVHHIAADGRSIQMMVNELMALYGDMPELAPIRYQAVEYALWEREQLATMARTQANDYWQKQFNQPLEPLLLADPKALGLKSSYQGSQAIFTIESMMTEQLRHRARAKSTTVFNLLLAVFAQLLKGYSGNRDLVIGVPMTPQLPNAFKDSVGLFVNTLPVRLHLPQQQDFAELLSHVGQQVTDAFSYQQVPLQEIVRLANQVGDDGYNGLFQVLFAYQQVQYAETYHGDIGLTPWHYSNETAKFALTLLVDDMGSHLQCRLEYDKGLLTDQFVAAMADSFVALLCGELPQSLVVGSRNEARLATVVEQIACVDPGKGALKWNGGQINHAEMAMITDALAAQLQQRGVGRGDVVALSIRRDNPLLVLLQMACLKLAAPLLAISDKYPHSRVEYMLVDSQPKLLISDKPNRFEIKCWNVSGLALHNIKPQPFKAAPPQLDDVAYVVYTSGTTGQPKGIEVCHRTLANLIEWQCHDFAALGIKYVLQFSTIGFDVALQEMLYAFASGSCYQLSEAELNVDFAHLSTISKELSDAVIFMPTSVFNQFATYLIDSGKPCGFKAIVVAGEALKLSTVMRRQLANQYSFKLFNHYGPAESHVVTAMQVDLLRSDDIHIGKPIARTKLRILDSKFRPVMPGCQGELFIGGVNLARGYLGSPEQTAAKFIDIGGERWYASGDLGRLRADGNIDYIGRKDNQIKIRGYRVEPSEVGKKLESLLTVQHAVVIGCLNPQGEAALAAYLKTNDATLDQIKAELAVQLPDYMLPTAWTKISEFDTTSHGKINTGKLPAPDWDKAIEAADGGGLDSVLLQVVAMLWQEVLGVTVNGSEAHFFRLGGHSLKVMQLATQIEAVLELKVAIARLMDCPKLAQQCAYLNELALLAGRELEAELMEGV